MERVSIPSQRETVLVNGFVRSVYNWMCIGLALTGFVAYYVSGNQAIQSLVFGNKMIFFGLIIAELALVFSLAGMVNKMSAATATALFYRLFGFEWGNPFVYIPGLHPNIHIQHFFNLCGNIFGL